MPRSSMIRTGTFTYLRITSASLSPPLSKVERSSVMRSAETTNLTPCLGLPFGTGRYAQLPKRGSRREPA